MSTPFVYYENNRLDDRREIEIGPLVDGFMASTYAGDAYDGWPLDRRLRAYLVMDVHATFDTTDPEFAPGYDVLFEAARLRFVAA